MNPQNERPPQSPVEQHYAVHGPVRAAVDAPGTHTASDRLYQVAALTAGIFLLVTLL